MGQAPGARSLAGHLVPPSESALLWALSAGRRGRAGCGDRLDRSSLCVGGARGRPRVLGLPRKGP